MPIDLFTNAAINPSKASAVTPQTADSSDRANLPPSTTTSAAAFYPPAQPGAPAVPAPTAAVRYTPANVQATPTTTSELPPAPQAGAFPVPLNASVPKSNLPPPPKAGEAFVPPPTDAPPISQPYPSQLYTPSPTTAYRAQPIASSTSTTTLPLSSYPVPLPTSQYEHGRQSLEGPPGYTQNPYASDLSPDQRRASASNSDSISGLASFGGDAPSVWDTAKQWAQKAGDKLTEAETEVWKRINK